MPSGRLLRCLIVLPWLVLAPPVGAQTLPSPDELADPAGSFVPRDRRLQGLLDQAVRELDNPEGDHRQALESLQRLIDQAEDVFIDPTMSSSLQTQAADLIAGLSDEGHRLYEETFGPQARALLDSTERDPQTARREIVRRFFPTSAGADAAYHLAAAEMDRGHLLEAARLLDRLRNQHRRADDFEPVLSLRCILCDWRSGATRHAAERLQAVVASQPDFQIGAARPGPLASLEAAQQWLTTHLGPATRAADVATRQWRMPNGSPSGNASVATVSPLFDDAWHLPVIGPRDADGPTKVEELGSLVEAIARHSDDADQAPVPALRPLIVNDLVVFPSYGLIKAVELHSGQLRWVALPADQTFADFLTSTTGMGSQQIASGIDAFLQQRAWIDATSSQLSSDGRQVYVLRDAGMVGGLSPQFSAIAQPNHPRRPRSFNALRAYDAVGGSWKWEVGGARSRASSPLAGTFFLGPPLEVDGTLYVLGEDLGQVRLHALSPETGSVEWSLPLANSDADIEEDLNRRLAGLSPTLAGGLLICPTGSGLVVAVDPMTRSLCWGTRYREPQTLNPQHFRRGPFIAMQGVAQQISPNELLRQPRWYDSSVVAAGSALLVAPPDVANPEDERWLICLDLLDGERRWQRPRGRGLFIGGVHKQSVLLVGSRQVEGIDLQTGRTLWTIPLEAPCGRGVRTGHLYHLPLATNEIVTIDMTAGRLLARSPVRSGSRLGNLIASGGQIVSLSASELRSFRPRAEVAEQIAHDLQAHADDPAALAARGELRLHEGDVAAGLDDLRKATTAGKDPRAQELLVSTLLEGLRTDFVNYRDDIDELERLTTDSPLRMQFLMTYAAGLIDAGETAAGFEQYLRLLQQTDDKAPLEYTSDGRWIRRERLILGRLATLYAAADETVRAELDEQVAAVPHNDDLFEMLPAALPHLRNPSSEEQALADGPPSQLSPAQWESRLLQARRTATDEQQGRIAARLIELYTAHQQPEPVVQLLQELETRWAEHPCLDETTGLQWAAAAREQADVVALLEHAVTWPTGQVEVSEGLGKENAFAPLRREGPTDPLTATFQFLPDHQGRLSIRDGYGRQLAEGVLHSGSRSQWNFQSQYVMQRGHRAVVFQGTQFRLLDLLGPQPRVVMDETLVEEDTSELGGLRMAQTRAFRRQGFRGTVLWSDVPGEYGSIGPLNDSLFCFVRNRSLHAHDPFTGQRFWTIGDVPHNAEIFADADYVLLVPVGQNVAHVYRALDGEKIGERQLPRDVVRDRRDADWGRHFLQIRSDQDGMHIAMYDPVAEQPVWQRTFDERFQWAPRDGYDLCILDEAGGLVVLDPLTGAVQLETTVDVPERLRSISVLSLPQQWLLTTLRPPPVDATSQLAPMLSPGAFPINGPVTAFERRTDQVQWSRNITNQTLSPGWPARWPVLMLSAILQSASPPQNGSRFPVLTRNVEVLNRQTGKTLFSTVSDATSRGRQVEGFWEVADVPPQLRVHLGDLLIEIRFLDATTSQPEEPSRQAPPREESTPQPAPQPSPAPPAVPELPGNEP